MSPVRVGIPKEIFEGERRVAATPATVSKMRKLGLEVVVEAGAGAAADYSDAAYLETGAEIAPDAASLWAQADIVLKVRPPVATGPADAEGHVPSETELLKEGAALIGFIWPGQHPKMVERLTHRKATVLAMDAVPRITRAQKMDALSAQANLVGYRAVVEAASALGRIFGGQMTAAGRSAPANVLIVGAGVAGLAAIAAAKGLGATVKAFDTRPAVREQVESLGARFLEFEFKESGEGDGGYAKEMSEAYIAAEQALIATHAKSSDVVICTALIPGRPAPVLLTSGAVVSMSPGSVVVDLAAEQGGNCPLTEKDKMVEKFGVKILGFTDLPSRLARQASDLYAMTVYNLLEDVYDEKLGKIELDLEDEVHRAAVVLQDGKLLWPPPTKPRPRSAAPPPEDKKPKAAAPHAPRRPRRGPPAQQERSVGHGHRGPPAAHGRVLRGKRLRRAPHGVPARVRRGLARCVERGPRAAYPAHERDQRHQRHHPRRRRAAHAHRRLRRGHAARGRRHPHRHDKRGGGLPRHAAHAEDVPAMIASVASIQRLAYLGAALLFIFSLRGLSTQETARRGNTSGILGMVMAVLVTALALAEPAASGAPSGSAASAWGLLGGAIAVGAAIGALLATRVAMTSMPELVAILHSFVGAAAVLVGIANYLEKGGESSSVHEVEVVVGVFIGAITFAGSVIAFGKLRGTIGSKPLLLLRGATRPTC